MRYAVEDDRDEAGCAEAVAECSLVRIDRGRRSVRRDRGVDRGQLQWIVDDRSGAVGVDQINRAVVDHAVETMPKRAAARVGAGQVGGIGGQGETVEEELVRLW